MKRIGSIAFATETELPHIRYFAITCEPNDSCAEIHNRMPVILRRSIKTVGFPGLGSAQKKTEQELREKTEKF
jgi:putative SOS response-associated peptidase YedK